MNKKTSKRLWLVMGCILINFFIFYKLAIMLNGDNEPMFDISAIGTALALLNAPLYGYLTAETVRPSGTNKRGDKLDPSSNSVIEGSENLT